VATRRRTPTSRTRQRTGGRRNAGPSIDLRISPELTRTLVGIVLLVVGAVTLIALFLPGQGILNHYVYALLRPVFGQGAWLLPILLLIAGAFVERAPSAGTGWGVSALGGLVTFVGGVGLFHLVWGGPGTSPTELSNGGGWLGFQLSHGLSALVSPAGAFVVLLGVLLAGLALLFNLTVRGFLQPFVAGGRAVAGALASAPAPDRSATGALQRAAREPAAGRSNGGLPTNGGAREGAPAPELPTPVPSPAPLSQTVWSGERAAPRGGGPGMGTAAGEQPAPIGSMVATGSQDGLPGEALLEAHDAPLTVARQPWILPDSSLLDPERPANGAGELDHSRNRRIIEEKLRSFQIPASVVGQNVGPVVTQYEVKPDARVKLSRVEALADDLAMALAARSIRIEAPIPGKDVVGIEIPNHNAEVVGFRGLWEDARMADAVSPLTFALGRDVSGKAYAVDLARMPHLLIAGATGSGKSVCVNALITSLLMRARPNQVRLILVDLKRVELASYRGLPHLLTDVIVEPGEAKAALNWAVRQMEERYKALAARSERNIGAYNANPRLAEDERLPYIVIVVDELADLMMREGRKVEDPIVKLAQKARAVGIHLVLATQRPSVNVVTGLIKANVPSRIAFAMSSNVDSRTVLDAPGAEDLIGRGDMLYQPADLPRAVRLQGVFVSDREVQAVTDQWRAQAPEPLYDPDVVAGGEESGEGGQFAWLAQLAEDEMTSRAAELVVTSGKASTSMLQTRLKVGFNRASRIIDELERVGIVGPQDPRNPAVPRQVYGPENWIRGLDDVDEP
jgi:S-DNA-T family DNA segregation ATPase FtsK/SpoIIIE